MYEICSKSPGAAPPNPCFKFPLDKAFFPEHPICIPKSTIISL